MYVIILVITSLPPKRPEESRSIYLSLKFYQNCNTKSLCVCVCVCVVCLDVCMCVQSVCMYVCAVCVQIWCAKNCARLFRYLGLKGELCYFSHLLSLSLSSHLSLSLSFYFIFLTLIILKARQDILKTVLQVKIFFLNQFVCRPYPPPNQMETCYGPI